MSKIKYLFEVVIERPNYEDHLKRYRASEYYLASHIKHVYERIGLDLRDESVDVVEIVRHVPVLNVLE
jgi:hypothetical protein